MGRCREILRRLKRQVGAVYSGPTAELVDQSRDSSLGLLIASGIFAWLVPGSPVVTDLGACGLTFKLGCRFFGACSDRFELLGERFGMRGVVCRTAEQVVLVARLLF